ncbi:MAG: FAD-dependent oxidoreductase [Beijerinckiaceae bacterium]|jgi:predicted NAD/FAD-binding protein|nr:FAD-dependent oxidoreductase [Beijerinckiaceae bacterium]
MRIAVIGAGIAGNAAAWALANGSSHQITVYEQEKRIGGHSATVDVDYDGKTIPVDTGFIVYNELNYPNLTQLFAHLGVATEASDMGFSVSSNNGAMEWAGRPTGILNGIFARRRNLVSLPHLNMIREMFRFNRSALEDRAAGRLTSESIGAYLDRGQYSRRFREEYLVPMGAAIWSMPPQSLIDFPADSFIAFFDNHRLLHWNRPVWRTVSGGSRAYVAKLTASFADRIRTGVGVSHMLRHDLGVTITDTTGHSERYDQVIIAAHSDQALAMLGDASNEERAILGAIPYRSNDVWLHRDPALMPRRRAAWAAWNVLQGGNGSEITLTYWMNALQNIDKRTPLFVTLNPEKQPRDDLTFGRYSYAHPQYRTGATAAQTMLPSIQGTNHTWFCGAWTGYGFHEDGLTSGLNVAETLGAVIPWRVSERRLAAAAE